MTNELRPVLPVGTVTFLVAEYGRSAGDQAASRWRDGTVAVMAAHGGVPVEDPADGGDREVGSGRADRARAGRLVAVFASVADAAAAALALQRAQTDGDQPGPRVGVHTGEARLGEDGAYVDEAVWSAGRLCAVSHGGQTLLSGVTAALVAEALPQGAWLVDLGIHRLRDLPRPERVFELRHADLPGDFPPLRSLDVLAANLPSPLTTFIGRGDELATVTDLVGRERLVTLTGAGGCGKTRLAIQAVADLAVRWPDGVWWVDLGPVVEPTRVAELVALTIRVMVEPTAGPLRALSVQLRDRRLLVCLDNCEHVAAASAEVAEALLRSCAGVSVLATSREPLSVPGETVWRVPALVEDEAVALFADRAALVHPGFAVDEANEEVVRTICRRLDGLPLAVELAAAWVRALTPLQIAAGLDDRFRLLSGGARGVIARQQTLAASVSWSHDLLEPLERTVFRRLAVFAGGFTIDAARRVCADGPVHRSDVLGAVGRLVDKSLVLADHGGDEARYRLLETIRQYAHDRLDAAEETAATRDRHLDHYLAVAETAEPELEDADQDIWGARLEADYANLRAALDWGLSAPDAERGRRLAAALPLHWLLRGHSHDGIRYPELALARAPDDRSVLQTKLLFGAAVLGGTGGRFDLTMHAAQRGLELATANDDDRHRGRCLDMLAYLNVYLDFAAARDLALDARRHAEAADDAFAIDLSLVLEGLALTNADRHDDARPVLAEALDRSQRRGDRNLTAFALTGQLYAAVFTGEINRAAQLGTEAVRLARPMSDYFAVGSTTSNLAWVKGLAGQTGEARRLMEPVVRAVEEASHAADSPTMAPTLGKLHLWDGDLAGAISWFERAVRFGEPFIENWVVGRALPGLATAHRLAGDPDAAHEYADRALALARKLPLPHALAEALDEAARLAAGDDPERAAGLHHEALAVRVQHRLRTFYVDSLDALAGHAARTGNPADAARLYAASDTARSRIGYPRPSHDRTEHQTTIATLHTTLGPDGFDTAWTEGTQLSLDEAVAYASRARGARGRPTTGWASLTPTELKVVGLAAEGLTNREIGARLLMSPNTVKTHLAHTYAKLDVTNRTELANVAATRRNQSQRDP